jgi:hypothetical protein
MRHHAGGVLRRQGVHHRADLLRVVQRGKTTGFLARVRSEYQVSFL